MNITHAPKYTPPKTPLILGPNILAPKSSDLNLAPKLSFDINRSLMMMYTMKDETIVEINTRVITACALK